MLHHTIHRDTGGSCHIHNIRTGTSLGMDLEGAPAFPASARAWARTAFEAAASILINFIMWSPALECHGPPLLHVPGSTIEPALHDVNRFCKGHAFSKPADLGRVHTQHRKDNNPVSATKSATRRVSSKTCP